MKRTIASFRFAGLICLCLATAAPAQAGALVCAESVADTLVLAGQTYYSPGETVPAWSIVDRGSVTLSDDAVVLIDGSDAGWLRGGQSVAVLLRQKLIGIKDFGKKTAK